MTPAILRQYTGTLPLPNMCIIVLRRKLQKLHRMSGEMILIRDALMLIRIWLWNPKNAREARAMGGTWFLLCRSRVMLLFQNWMFFSRWICTVGMIVHWLCAETKAKLRELIACGQDAGEAITEMQKEVLVNLGIGIHPYQTWRN